MSNYVQSTNFATKDALPSGDPLKIVKGTEINTEFNNIAVAIATKLDTASLYPIGSIYINASNAANPASLFGFGTWAAFGAGRVLVGFNSSNALFDAAEETGGSYDASLPSHTHTGTTGGQSANHSHSGTTSTAGAHVHTMVFEHNQFDHGITGNVGDNGGLNPTRTSGSMSTEGAHDHSFSTGGVSADHNHGFTTNSTGSSATNANIQPYITVYMWKRTA
jgi:hypothetical protein